MHLFEPPKAALAMLQLVLWAVPVAPPSGVLTMSR